jgi:hypothetical protein
MKSITNKATRGESGAALVLVIILLLIGGLIAAPLLAHMGTGILTGEVYEGRTAELYAADAGVEDAVWKIQNKAGGVANLTKCRDSMSYAIADAINGKTVTVNIVWDSNTTNTIRYFIESTAVGGDGGGVAGIGTSTAVEAYLDVQYMDFSNLLDNAIVSNDTITIQPNNVVDGDVWLPDADDLRIYPPNADVEDVIDGEVKDSEVMVVTWPPYDQVSSYYWQDVKALDPYPEGYVLHIPSGTSEDNPYIIGPLLAGGDLTITGNGWIKLDGTIYVKGSVFTNPTPEIHLDLNGHTIFAERNITLKPGVWLHGSGCIIARYDIDFQPNLDTEDESFVLVLSLEGMVAFKPGTSFTGCVAGQVDVQLQPGNTLGWISPEGKGLDFPMGLGDGDTFPPVTAVRIESWEVTQQ